MGEPQLLPCPYCGQSDFLVERLDNSASVVICQGLVDEHSACLARGPVGVQDDDGEDQPGYAAAVREWNKRVQKSARVAVPDGWRLVPIEPTELMLGRCHLLSRIARAAWIDMLAAAPHSVSGVQKPACESAEERFEHYLQNAIDNAPDPLRRLGEYLSHVIDEDEWATAERMINGAVIATAPPAAQDLSGLLDISRKILAKLQHPTAAVHALDMWKLEEALAPFAETAEQGE